MSLESNRIVSSLLDSLLNMHLKFAFGRSMSRK